METIGDVLWSCGLGAALDRLVEWVDADCVVLRLEQPGRPVEWVRCAPGSRRFVDVPPADDPLAAGRGTATRREPAAHAVPCAARIRLTDGSPVVELEIHREGGGFDDDAMRALRAATRHLAAHALLVDDRHHAREREAFLREITDEGPTIKHVYLPDRGVSIFANRACRRFLDDADFWITDSTDTPQNRHVWLRHVHPDDERPLRRQLRRTETMPVGRSIEGTFRFRRRGGIAHLRLWSTRLPEHESRNRGAILVTALDETDKHQLREHVARLQASEKSEMRRMIHDGICQDLIGLRMTLGRILDDEATIPERMAQELQSLGEALGRSLQDAREISRGIGPFRVDRVDLRQAIQDVLHGTENRFGVKCRMVAREVSPLLSDHDARQLYWIAREAVLNAAKHADADTIHVVLLSKNGSVALRVTDDGHGFDESTLDTQRSNGSGQGLSILRQRARMIDARLTVDSAPGEGTVITCELDLDGSGENHEE